MQAVSPELSAEVAPPLCLEALEGPIRETEAEARDDIDKMRCLAAHYLLRTTGTPCRSEFLSLHMKPLNEVRTAR